MTAQLAEARIEGETRIIGYALSHPSFTTDYGERGVYVVDLYVESGWRRQGVATRLLAVVAAKARRGGATHLWWASMPRNVPARRFYAELGANDERIHSHSIFGAPFERLARSGMPKRRPKG